MRNTRSGSRERTTTGAHMRLVSLRHTATHLRAELEGVDETFCNLLRRALSDVAVPAVTHVDFATNTSAFPNETLAHRIGLLPLRSAFAEHRPATLRAVGPCVVRSGAIVSPDAEVVDPELLVVCLAEGERLDLTLHIGLGTGRSDHARHAAVVAPRVVRRHAGFCDAATVPLEAPLPLECFCATTPWGTPRCAECAGRKRALDQKHAPLTFFVEFESTGALAPLEILRRGIERATADTLEVARRLAA